MMLRPTKHSHPDQTIINVSVILLKYLKLYRIAKFDDLLNKAKKTVTGGDILFLPSLNFLYIMGVIEYHSKTDSIEYVGLNEAL